jgi:hypothetical protein
MRGLEGTTLAFPGAKLPFAAVVDFLTLDDPGGPREAYLMTVSMEIIGSTHQGLTTVNESGYD